MREWRAAAANPRAAGGDRGLGWRPTQRLTGVLTMGAVAYLLAAQSQSGWLYVGLAVVGGAVPLALLYPLLAVRGLRATAHLPALAEPPHEGQTVVAQITLSNPSWLARYWLALDEQSGLSAATGPLAFIPLVPARGSVTLAWELRPSRRGVYQAPALRVWTRAPFGLAEATAAVAAPAAEVVVYPRWWPLAGTPGGAREEDSGTPQRRQAQGSDFYGTRPYRSGDSLRWVHWRSTARHGALVVREFEEPVLPSLAIVLLQPAGDGEPRSAAPLFDVAVRVAASAAQWAADHGHAVHLHANSAVPPAPGNGISRRRANEYLARVAPDRAAPPPGTALARVPRTSLVLAILTAPDPAAAATLIAMRRRGAAVVVALGSAESAPTMRTTLEEAGLRVVTFGADDEMVDLPLC